MKVRVDELPKSGRVFQFHRQRAWFKEMITIEEDAREMALDRPVNVDLELIPEEDKVKVKGRVTTVIQLPCSRCLRGLSLDIDEAFAFVLLRPLPADIPEELDLGPEDLDTEFYDGVVIDLDRIVAEQIFLALPQKPLCRPDCRGICPGCGKDLNREECACPQVAEDSPFAVLKSLRTE